jgi:glycosyltransferase involved in cell wall biosynthesis
VSWLISLVSACQMFKYVQPKIMADPEPWTEKLPLRMTRFNKRSNTSTYKVAYYYHKAPDNSTFRYRIYNMCELINNSEQNIAAVWITNENFDDLIEIIPNINALVICRSTIDAQLMHLIYFAKAHKVRLIFDSDDLVFVPKYVPLIVNTVTSITNPQLEEGIWNYWYAYISRLEATLQACDEIFLSTLPLLKIADEQFSKKTTLVPNFMNSAQLSYSKSLYDAKIKNNFEREGFTIGYFSGSPSHNKDFRIAAAAVSDILDANKEINLMLVGYLDDLSGLERFDKKRVRILPHTNYLQLQELISRVQVNIAPLQQNVFTECKSVLKFFDAAAVGTPSIVSPTENMKLAIIDGVTGMISSDQLWFDALHKVIESYDDLGIKMGQAAYEISHNEYSSRFQEQNLIETFISY